MVAMKRSLTELRKQWSGDWMSARSDGVYLSSAKVTKRQEGQVNVSTCPLNAASLALARIIHEERE